MNDSLVLLGEFSSGGRTATLTKYLAPLAAARVRRLGATLGLPVVDLHVAYNKFGHGGAGMLLREFQYTLHPSRAGSCVLFHALAKVEPRLPDCRTSCIEILRNTTEAGHLIGQREWLDRLHLKLHRRGSALLEPLPARTGHAARFSNGSCLVGAERW